MGWERMLPCQFALYSILKPHLVVHEDSTSSHCSILRTWKITCGIHEGVPIMSKIGGYVMLMQLNITLSLSRESMQSCSVCASSARSLRAVSGLSRESLIRLDTERTYAGLGDSK